MPVCDMPPPHPNPSVGPYVGPLGPLGTRAQWGPGLGPGPSLRSGNFFEKAYPGKSNMSYSFEMCSFMCFLHVQFKYYKYGLSS